jgi:hypothetical protein
VRVCASSSLAASLYCQPPQRAEWYMCTIPVLGFDQFLGVKAGAHGVATGKEKGRLCRIEGERQIVQD